MKKFLPLLLCVFLVLPACANIKDDRTRTTTEGALAGAGAGAAIGAIIGHFAGSAKAGALIGAALGGATGAMVGDHIADKKEQYATREKWLDACIASATQKNRELAAYSHRLRQESIHLDRVSKQMAEQYQQQKLTRDHLRKANASYTKKKQEIDNYIVTAQTEVAKQKQVLADVQKNNDAAYAQKIEYEIAQLEECIAELSALSEEMANISDRLSVYTVCKGMIMHHKTIFLSFFVGLVLLGGCTGTTDPSKGGLFSYNPAAYERRLAEREDYLADAEAQHRGQEARAASLEREVDRKYNRVAHQQQQINAMRANIARDRQRLDKAAAANGGNYVVIEQRADQLESQMNAAQRNSNVAHREAYLNKLRKDYQALQNDMNALDME